MAAGTGGLGLHYAEGGALLTAFLPGAVAVGAGFGLGTLRRAGAAAFVADAHRADLHLLLAAPGRLLKGDDDRRGNIASPAGRVGLGAAPAPSSEKGGEDVAQIDIHIVEAVALIAARAEVRINPRLTVLGSYRARF